MFDQFWKTLGNIFGNIEELFNKALAPLAGVIHLFTNIKDSTVGIVTDAEALVQECIDEFEAIKNFKQDSAWRTRVINVPAVIDHTQKLIEIPRQVADAVKDVVQQVKSQIGGGEEFNIEELEGIDDLRGILGKFGPKIAKGAEKLVGAVALIAGALETIHNTIKDLKTIVDAIKEVRNDIEHLDLIFLQQRNKRRTVRNVTVRERLGRLHG